MSLTNRILTPPKPPLDRVIRPDVSHFCTNCGSTTSKKYWWMLLSKRICDNKECLIKII